MNNIARNFNRCIRRDWKRGWENTLVADLVVEVNLSMPSHCPMWQNRWMRLESIGPGRTRITIFAGYSWDGCTGVPDVRGTYAASGVHDPIYQFAEDIAVAFGWTVRRVLAWADEAFLQIMRKHHCPVAGLYFVGVRLFGYAFHEVAKWFREDGRNE